jgi:hypothetical protein
MACGTPAPFISGQPQRGRAYSGRSTISLQRTRFAPEIADILAANGVLSGVPLLMARR